jgi:hypothetical protein
MEAVDEVSEEPQEESVTQGDGVPVSVNVEVHQDANPEVPEVSSEDIKEELSLEIAKEQEERREDNDQWQAINELRTQLQGIQELLKPKTSEELPQTVESSIAEEPLSLLEPAASEEQRSSLRKRKSWVF